MPRGPGILRKPNESAHQLELPLPFVQLASLLLGRHIDVWSSVTTTTTTKIYSNIFLSEIDFSTDNLWTECICYCYFPTVHCFHADHIIRFLWRDTWSLALSIQSLINQIHRYRRERKRANWEVSMFERFTLFFLNVCVYDCSTAALRRLERFTLVKWVLHFQCCVYKLLNICWLYSGYLFVIQWMSLKRKHLLPWICKNINRF